LEGNYGGDPCDGYHKRAGHTRLEAADQQGFGLEPVGRGERIVS